MAIRESWSKVEGCSQFSVGWLIRGMCYALKKDSMWLGGWNESPDLPCDVE